ncbi:MAG: TIM barrel protein [Vicinamibacteria bacterium]
MSIRVGNAPVSWAVYEADRPNPPFARVLDQIADSGYEGTELGPYGYLPTSPEALAAELSKRHLGLGSSFVPLPLEDASRRTASVEAALKVGRLLATQGVQEVILADDEDPHRKSIAGRVPADGSASWNDRQWAEVKETVDAVARALRDALGMRVVLHHHAGTYVETPAEVDRFLAETDPEIVGLLLDTGHFAYGGGSPLECVRRHGARIRYVHLKDARADELKHIRTSSVDMDEAWKRGVFCPLGAGVVPFPALVETLRGQGYSGWMIVEQDVVPGPDGKLDPDPFESAKQSRAYLRGEVGL